MAESADTSPAPETPQPTLPDLPPLADLRLPINQLNRVIKTLSQALTEAGVGGQEFHSLLASGIKASCVACGLSVTGAEIGELSAGNGETRDRPLSPKLERLNLGYCPRNGCESRFYKLEIIAPARFEKGWVLARTQQLIKGGRGPLLNLRPSVSPETRRLTQRLALIALATLFVAFVAYRLIFYRSQPIPFVQPKSPYTVEPASIDPNQR